MVQSSTAPSRENQVVEQLPEGGRMSETVGNGQLRKATVRLAHRRPDLRGDLLPLLKTAWWGAPADYREAAKELVANYRGQYGDRGDRMLKKILQEALRIL